MLWKSHDSRNLKGPNSSKHPVPHGGFHPGHILLIYFDIPLLIYLFDLSDMPLIEQTVDFMLFFCIFDQFLRRLGAFLEDAVYLLIQVGREEMTLA